MEELDLTLTDMANGGAALGRDENNRVIFVPFAIPGEKVHVVIDEDKGRFAHAHLLDVLEPSKERVEPRCPHFGLCGGCHFQHMTYQAQLQYKREVIVDQLARLGKIEDAPVQPTLPNPEPWAYSVDVSFSPTPAGNLGFWSPILGEVMEIEECHIIRPGLLALFQDIDLGGLPGLRTLSLRVGDDGALLVTLEVEGLEEPELSTDFPVSVAMVLPDGTAANLVGDNYLVQAVKGRDFHVSAGSFFYPSPPAGAQLVETVLEYAALSGRETVVDAYCGVGTLTAFLTQHAAQVHAIDSAPDTVTDAATNLEDADNVTLYEGLVEEVLPGLETPPVLVVDPPPDGLSRDVVKVIAEKGPGRLIYVSADVATLARDGRQLADAGYTLQNVQPIDMFPQTYHTLTVSLWIM